MTDGLTGATKYKDILNAIEKFIHDDHLKFGRHYEEILCRESRHIIKNRQATRSEDMTEGFDYAITLDKTNIAVRTRSHDYLKFHDFTIRCENNGWKTELEKIKSGAGDLYLYCWKTEDGKSIKKYWLIDLHILRSSGVLDKQRSVMLNGDGTKFISISSDELFKSNALLASDTFTR